MLDYPNHVELVDPADHLGEFAEAELRHQLADFLSHKEEIIDDVLGLPGEALAQYRVLGRNPNRARIQVTLAHHHAAGGDQRCGRETKFVGTDQGRDHDIAAGAQPPSTCTAMRPRNPFSTKVCWVSARPISQGEPAWVSEVRGLAPVPPSKPAIVTWSARAFETPAATVPTPTSETSLTDTAACGLAFFKSWISCARSSIE